MRRLGILALCCLIAGPVLAQTREQGPWWPHPIWGPDDQAGEVARLVALGATRIDIGQGDASWVVLADPEGNEFCVLSSAATTD